MKPPRFFRCSKAWLDIKLEWQHRLTLLRSRDQYVADSICESDGHWFSVVKQACVEVNLRECQHVTHDCCYVGLSAPDTDL